MSLLDVDHLAGFRGGNQQIRLPAKKGRDLQDINRLRRKGALFGSVNISQHRQPGCLPDFLENRQGGFKADAPGAGKTGPVRLVKRGLVDKPDIQPVCNFFQLAGDIQCMAAAFQRTRPGQ